MNRESEPRRYPRRSVPGTEDNKCKSPKVGGCLECPRNLQQERMAGAQRMRGRMVQTESEREWAQSSQATEDRRVNGKDSELEFR